MQDDRDRQKVADIDPEATSTETLSDVEEAEGATDEKTHDGRTEIPSPDGTPAADNGEHSRNDDPAPI